MTILKHLFVLSALMMACFTVKAQQLNIIPQPSAVKVINGTRTIPQNIKLVTADGGHRRLLKFFNQWVSASATRQRQYIDLDISGGPAGPGSYRLSTSGKRIGITAADTDGLFNGVISLLQLCKTSKVSGSYIQLPRVVITDTPRYAWRGFMLDESRHFFGKQTVEMLLDWMAFYKLNRFHWHLTDANGWRIEIKKYPLLTQVGARGNFTDSTAAPQYYTQQQVREIVAYAAERNITIIPEVDMPGHASAATRAYPWLSGGYAAGGYNGFTFDPSKTSTYNFLADVLVELRSLFPGQTIHIGGDEVALGIKAWDGNTGVQELMKQQGFSNTNQTELYFISRVADSLYKTNTRVMCWDEAVAANLSPQKTMITWWRQNKPESLKQALNKGFQVIICPRLPLYFDFVQDSTHRSGRRWDGRFNRYTDVYNFPEDGLDAKTIANKQIIGVQANLWTETVVSPKRLQFLVFPRLAALAEAAWLPAAKKNTADFGKRLQKHLTLYQAAGLYYFNPFDVASHPEPVDIPVKNDEKD